MEKLEDDILKQVRSIVHLWAATLCNLPPTTFWREPQF